MGPRGANRNYGPSRGKQKVSLDVQILVGREIFSILYQLKLKILPIYLIKINKITYSFAYIFIMHQTFF
jgi:hypothetical protein